jgi:3-hydroxybutyrate dehydrogenase
MNDILSGKAALVTGSTSGIGLGIARALAAQGCNVLLNGFGDPAAIQALCQELGQAFGVRVAHHGANLRHPPEIAGLVQSALETFGRLDVLVNNAGIQHVAPVETLPPERWDDIIAINLSAAFHAIHHALPYMRRQGWGRIINTASTHGLVASVNKVAYVASKHGLVGLTKVVALETAGSGITCNAICPGWTHTTLIEGQIAERAAQLGGDRQAGERLLLAEKQPSGQFVTVDQLGALAVFLCSEAAAQLTGAALPVDGGWTAQ